MEIPGKSCQSSQAIRVIPAKLDSCFCWGGFLHEAWAMHNSEPLQKIRNHRVESQHVLGRSRRPRRCITCCALVMSIFQVSSKQCRIATGPKTRIPEVGHWRLSGLNRAMRCDLRCGYRPMIAKPRHFLLLVPRVGS